MAPTAQSEYITVEESAQLTNFHESSISRWIAQSWLPPPIRFGPRGRHRRWRRAVIEEFLAKLESGQDALRNAEQSTDETPLTPILPALDIRPDGVYLPR